MDLVAAIEVARTALAAHAAAPARAYPVRRLDRLEASYALVVFDSPDGVAVVTVDAATGAVRSRVSRLAAGPIVIGEDEARELADAPPSAVVELVWLPCRQSLSPLYPLWAVRSIDRVRFVDQTGAVHAQLDPAGPGGAAAA